MSPNAKYLVWYEYCIYDADRLVAKFAGPKERRLCYCEKHYVDVDDPYSKVEPCYCEKREQIKELMITGVWVKSGYQETIPQLFGETFPSITEKTRIIKCHVIERDVCSGRC